GDVWCRVEDQGKSRLKAGEGGRGAGVVRVGLAFIRDWSEETATAVVAERERGGPFRSVGDVVRRAPPQLKRPAIEHLVWVGGCDGFGLTRRELVWQGGLWLPPTAHPGDDARQRPETAKGFIFVLLEDEAGMVNVIVRPDVYQRHRPAIRSEPLLWVRGKLAKDDGTVNLLAEEVRGLQCGMRSAECELEVWADNSALRTPQCAVAFLRSWTRVER